MSRFVKGYLGQGVSAADSGGTAVTGNVTPTSLASGTPTEIIASTSEDWAGFWVQVYSSTADLRAIASVHTGAASSEVRIATFPAHCHGNFRGTISFQHVPIPVPAGTRISVTVDVHTADTLDVSVVGDPAANHSTLPPFTRMDFGPVDLDPSGAWGATTALDIVSINTLTAWTEMSESGTNSGNNQINGDSLGEQYKYLSMVETTVNGATSNNQFLLDFAYGPSGQEVMFIEKLPASSTTTEAKTEHNLWVPWNRPAGDRISRRHQASVATDAAKRIAILGLL